MKKLVLAALGILGLIAVLSHHHRRAHVEGEMFNWWTPDV
jgi:hypothetical protein